MCCSVHPRHRACAAHNHRVGTVTAPAALSANSCLCKPTCNLVSLCKAHGSCRTAAVALRRQSLQQVALGAVVSAPSPSPEWVAKASEAAPHP